MQIIVKASTYTNMESKKDVLVNKPWTVSFNKPLSVSTVNTENIKVIGENNEYKEIKVSLANSNKNVIIEPIKNYEPYKTYTVIVTENVNCADGKPLSKEVRMDFTTNNLPTKPSEFTVSSVEDIMVDLEEGSQYIFPETVQVTMTNNMKKEVEVVWNSNLLDTSNIGAYTFLGTIKGSSEKSTLVVNVIPAKKKYKVVLDAGHGGFDPGAVGPTGLKEKDITLSITLKVGSILVNNGVEAVYTRTTDNISWSTNQAQNLQARCDISNKANPNYFVSIHANSFSQPSPSGIETYYFTGNMAGQKLAQAVQTEIVKETGRVDRKIKTTSNFYVIKNVAATAILVETAFISNPEEEKLLATDAYQYKLAKAISTGILKSLGISNIVY
jgi:N-acetylmuramoyl-L-alanine amidase